MSAKTMASSVEWTIPSDPGQRLQRGGSPTPNRPRPRVKPEAARIAESNQQGSVGLLQTSPPPEKPRPRIKPEAARYAESNQKGSVGLLFQPETKPATMFKRPEQKDHSRENVRRMREIQDACKQRQKTSGPVRAVHRPPSSLRYDNVESKVAQTIKSGSPGMDSSMPRPRSASLAIRGSPVIARRTPPPDLAPLDLSKVHGGDESHRHPQSAPKAAARPLSAPRQQRQSRTFNRPVEEPRQARPRSASLPRQRTQSATGQGDLQTRPFSGKNFITENARRASQAHLRRSPSAEHLEVMGVRRRQEMESYRRGAVPSYLLKRQDEWRREEEERIANRPDPLCPPGHVLLPSAERLHTLQQLNANYEELTKQLQAMPLRDDTTRVKSRKAQLQHTLMEMEEAIKIFSRPRVYVRE